MTAQPEPASPRRPRVVTARVRRVLDAVQAEGLMSGGKAKRISGRVQEGLHAAAVARSGLDGNDLIEYALAKVAAEDNFNEVFTRLEGSISRDINIEFF